MALSNCLLFGVIVVVITCFLCSGERLGGPYGGREDADVNSKEVKKAAAFAELEVNKQSNSMNYMKVTEIVKAQKQLVAGMNYFLTLIMTSTDCRNNPKSPEDLGQCKLNDKEKGAHETQSCDVTVYERAWENKTTLTHLDCQPAKERKTKQTKLN